MAARHRRRSRHPRRKLAALAVTAVLAALVPALFAGTANAIVAGAGYTTSLTDDLCQAGTMVNCNTYAAKDDVYISGGPTAGGIRTPGDYYFAVIAPGSQNAFFDGTGLLSSDSEADRTVTVGFSGGNPVITQNLGTHPTATNDAGKFVIRAAPFDDTPNAGGVYIMALCKVGATSSADCKFDAFKVLSSVCPPETVCEPLPFGTVSGTKYYDRDLDGMRDAGEEGISGWQIGYVDGTSGVLTTDTDGAFSQPLEADTYTFTERQSTNLRWFQTGNTADQTSVSGGSTASLAGFVYTVGVVDGSQTSGLDFGNVCKVVSTSGKTMGFWANNGNASITEADLTALRALHLVNEDGSAFDPANRAQIKTFLNGATSVKAKNMAFMLSGQVVALHLNVAHGYLDGTDTVLTAGGPPFSTIAGTIGLADSSLAAHPITTTKIGAIQRPVQERLKNVADGLNQNNGLYVVPGTLDGAMTRCGAPTFAAG